MLRLLARIREVAKEGVPPKDLVRALEDDIFPALPADRFDHQLQAKRGVRGSTFYVAAVPRRYPEEGRRTFVLASDGIVYRAEERRRAAAPAWDYLAEDGGKGKPPKPYEPVSEEDLAAAAGAASAPEGALSLVAAESAARRACGELLKAAAAYRRARLSDLDADEIGELPDADGPSWGGLVDRQGEPFHPAARTGGILGGYRFVIHPGRNAPESTCYVGAAPVKQGVTGRRTFVLASDGVLYEAEGKKTILPVPRDYLEEDGGKGIPPEPFKPVRD